MNAEFNCYRCTDLEYLWSPATGLNGTSVANPIADVNKTTTYTVSVTNPYSCEGIETATGKVTVKIVPPEILYVKLAENQARLSVKGKYESYLWSTGETTRTITVGPGTYTAIVTAKNGCSMETEPFVFNQTGINDVKAEEAIIYPNPANDKIHIYIPGSKGKNNVEIFDLQGMKIIESEIYNSENEVKIDGLVKGMYILYIKSKDKYYVYKFIKE